MGRSNLRNLDGKKWVLREKKEEKKKDGKNHFDEARDVILFESVKQIVWNWCEREKSEPTKRIDFVDVCRNAIVGSK